MARGVAVDHAPGRAGEVARHLGDRRVGVGVAHGVEDRLVLPLPAPKSVRCWAWSMRT